jgi:hypothetical protein
MASLKAYKILGQALPGAAVLDPLYEAPVGQQAVCSTLVVCNQNASQPAAFRIAVIPAGQNVSRASYLFYDELIDANKSRLITIGMTLQPGDTVKVFSSIPDLSFNLFGSQFAV